MEDLLVKVPMWAKLYSLILVGAFVAAAARMWRESDRGSKELKQASDLIEESTPASARERRFGRSAEVIERLRARFDAFHSGSDSWWQPVDGAIERYVRSDTSAGRSEAGYFLVTPVQQLLAPEALIDRYYSRSQWQVIPGLLTSLGLLGTFVALLLGLNELKTNDVTKVVTGVDILIGNLSGKFATSVVALFLSVVFMAVDSFICQRRLDTAVRDVMSAIESTLPYLPPSRILLDMQQQSIKQATSLGHISSDVVDKFAAVFKADLGPLLTSGMSSSVAHELQSELVPVLNRVSSVMQEVGAAVSRLEAEKQDSIVGQLQGLIETLEKSLRDSLAEMGRNFQQSLSASTKTEFGELAGVVKGSAAVLGDMTASFASMESALRSIVQEAHTSTTTQRQASVEQTERLNQLVEGLMIKLNGAASENFSQVGQLLTRVVTDLSSKVTGLSEDLVEAVRKSSTESQVVVQATLEQAGSWSAQSSAQLETLLNTLQTKSIDFEKAGMMLLEAQEVLQATLVQNNETLRNFGAAASGVRTYTESLAGLQSKLEEQGRSAAQITALSRESVSKLSEAAARHDEFLGTYRSVFTQYKDVFDGLDSQLAKTLNTILDKLTAYNQAVESNFRHIVESANDVVPNMAAKLRDATDELREQLEELTDTLAKSNAKGSRQ